MALFVRRRWPKVLAAVGVLAAVVALLVVMTRDDPPRGTADPEIVETAEPVPDPTPPSVSLETVLSAPVLRPHAEKQVQAERVRVLSVPGPSAAWVGTPSARVLVVVTGVGPSFSGVSPGARLSFTATVRLVDPRSGFGRALGLGAADDAELERRGGYLEVAAFETA